MPISFALRRSSTIVCFRPSKHRLRGWVQDLILFGFGVVGLITGAAWSVVSSGSAGLFSSSFMAATSDFSIRSDRPTPRAASGSFLAPSNRMNAAAMISQCHQDILPMSFLLESEPARRWGDGIFSAGERGTGSLLQATGGTWGRRVWGLPGGGQHDGDADGGAHDGEFTGGQPEQRGEPSGAGGADGALPVEVSDRGQHDQREGLGEDQVAPVGFSQRGPGLQHDNAFHDAGQPDRDDAEQRGRAEPAHRALELLGEWPQVDDQREQATDPDRGRREVHGEHDDGEGGGFRRKPRCRPPWLGSSRGW